MKKILLLFTLSLFSIVSYAQEETSIDEKINELVAPATKAISKIILYPVPILDTPVPLVVAWLVLAALIFTIYFGFVNVRAFGHAISITKGAYDNPDDKGEVSHFQALTAALSGTVGLGNIAGVALAISAGGPGASLWMIIAGFLGMTSKFVECTLGVKYRDEYEDGSVSGGPMYYLSKALPKKGKFIGGLGKVMAVFFAIMCIGGSFGGGNMFQGNQAARQLVNITGGDYSPLQGYSWVIGVVMAILVALVIIGGIRSIAKVTEKIVPIMCGIYVLAALIVVFSLYDKIPETLILIFTDAFSFKAVGGGVLGAMIIGFQRAAFSNEAGVGSASIAHSAVKTDEPITEGVVALLEPFIDTIVVCTMTALVIIMTGEYLDFDGSGGTAYGVSLTSAAFASVISWFPYVLTLAVVLFAFSTMISWSYYGLKAWIYLFGNTRVTDIVYKSIFCFFIVIGSAMDLSSVTDFSDAMILAMSFANIIGLYLLAPAVKRDLKDYFRRIRSGEIKKFK